MEENNFSEWFLSEEEYNFKVQREIQNILEAMGVDPDSNLGQFLTAGTYALLMYSGARVKAPTVNKYNNNTTNYIKK